MIKTTLAAMLLAAALVSRGAAQASSGPQIINLSLVEALVSIDESTLAGVFSYVPEKDGPAAFADLITHNKKSLKKFTAKVEKVVISSDIGKFETF